MLNLILIVLVILALIALIWFIMSRNKAETPNDDAKSCTSDSNCTGLEKCIDGICQIPATDNNSCTSDTECTGLDKCVDGTCQVPTTVGECCQNNNCPSIGSPIEDYCNLFHGCADYSCCDGEFTCRCDGSSEKPLCIAQY